MCLPVGDLAKHEYLTCVIYPFIEIIIAYLHPNGFQFIENIMDTGWFGEVIFHKDIYFLKFRK